MSDPKAVQRAMIARTIKEHLDKEKRLRPLGVKVLSLFFIDEVAKYRQYDEQGNAIKGEYALMFEEEYKRLAKHPDYQSLFKEVDLSACGQRGAQRLLLYRQEKNWRQNGGSGEGHQRQHRCG